MNESAQRQQLRQTYLQQKDRAGIVRIVNRVSQRCWLGASVDTAATLNRLQFELKMGQHRNAQLQRDYRQVGFANFDFEVVEKICLRDQPGWNLQEELQISLSLWQTEYSHALIL